MPTDRNNHLPAERPFPDRAAERPEICGLGVGGGERSKEKRQLRALEELREIGMGLARGLEAQAAEGADVGLAFTRIARAVRQIIAMEQEITGLREARERQVRVQRETQEAEIRARGESERKESVRLAVKEAVRVQRPELERYEVRDVVDDLFNDYDDYDRGTPAEIFARLCKELGVEADLSIWEEGALACGIPSSGDTPSPSRFAGPSLSPAAEGGSLRHAGSDLRLQGRGDFERAGTNGHDPPQ